MDLQLTKVPVEGDDLAASVLTAVEPTQHHAVFHLGEIDEFVPHGFGGNVHVHASLGRVLIEVEKPFRQAKILGEVGHRFEVVFAPFFLGVNLLRFALLAFPFLFPFLAPAFHRLKAQKERGK